MAQAAVAKVAVAKVAVEGRGVRRSAAAQQRAQRAGEYNNVCNRCALRPMPPTGSYEHGSG